MKLHLTYIYSTNIKAGGQQRFFNVALEIFFTLPYMAINMVSTYTPVPVGSSYIK